MNRTVLTLSLIILLSACSDSGGNSNSSSSWDNSRQVNTLSGSVQAQATDNGAWAWLAIPYAAPPVDSLRWQAPQDPKPWNGYLANTSPSAVCTQFSQDGSALIGSEDCLYLNVWRPQSSDKNLPVYVWIHGGGNTAGSSSVEDTLGAKLAVRSDVVYVSMNYRLGPFGWLNDSALHNGDPDTDSGNFGTLDIIKSLQWIQDNIERFGGDPDNVIITGESAGGINVLTMLLSPRAEGLFAKAMSQSGLLPDISPADAARFADTIKPEILVAEGVAVDVGDASAQLAIMSDQQLKEILLQASAASIFNAVPQIGSGLLSMPIIIADGQVIPANGPRSLVEGNYANKVPLILGTNSGDVRLFQAILGGSLSANPELYNAAADIGGKLWKAAGADDLAAAMVKITGQPDIYVYSFEWGHYEEDGSGVTPAPYNYFMGSAHSLDIPFFLDTLDAPGQLTSLLFTENNRASRELLSDAMISYLQNFIRSGNPNGDHPYPDWQPWSNADGSGKYIILDADFNDLQISMAYEAVSKQAALDALAAIPDNTLRNDVSDFLLDFTISCALFSTQPSVDCVYY
jgi:para-nitrobenzyl esterase